MSIPDATTPIVEILVDPQGNTRVQTRGIAGSSCRAASRYVEEALGRCTAERLTPEFYQLAATEQQLRQGH